MLVYAHAWSLTSAGLKSFFTMNDMIYRCLQDDGRIIITDHLPVPAGNCVYIDTNYGGTNKELQSVHQSEHSVQVEESSRVQQLIDKSELEGGIKPYLPFIAILVIAISWYLITTKKSKHNGETTAQLDIFAQTTMLAHIHMALASALIKDDFVNLSAEIKIRFFAFELGVLEYFDQTLLRPVNDVRTVHVFLDFLNYYTQQTYPSNYDEIYNMWVSMITKPHMQNERKLGFESVNDGVNEDGTRRVGHAPLAYLYKCLGMD